MSDQTRATHRRPGVVTRIAIVLAVASAVRYFAWRVTDTFNPAAVWFFGLFLAAELVGFGEVVLFYLTTWRQRRREPRPPTPGRRVDVFIPTYNEPVSLLRDTAVCAVSMRYPHTTYLLDDGNRPEVAVLARELGCRYLARPDRAHAKAGNLNHALAHSEGELVVVLDADHVPMPDLIERLVGFFDDPRMGIVQANQDFYNLDSFQHQTDWQDLVSWQQQELFFSIIQPGKDAFGAAMYCGSPAMLSRAALDAIGGFATETVTEDMHTGLRMMKRGYRVAYFNATVARGLAPQTFRAYETQWHRWGLGAMQVLRSEHPILGRGLTLGQRLCYLASFWFYWTSYQKLVYLLVPPFSVATGLFPLRTDPATFARYFLPYLVFNLLASACMQGGFAAFIRTERYNLIKLGAMLRSVEGFVRRKAQFSVTPKARDPSANLRQVMPYLVLVTPLVAAVGWGVLRLLQAPGRFEVWAYGVNVFFALFFLYLLVPAVILALRRRELRTTYRFPQRLDLAVRYRLAGAGDSAWSETFARNLNRFGLSLTLDVALPRETTLELEFDLPPRRIHALGSARWSQEIRRGKQVRIANGIRFERIAVEDQDAIARFLFWEVSARHGELLRLTASSQTVPPARRPNPAPEDLLPPPSLQETR